MHLVSVWEDLPSLFRYLYRTDHVDFFRRRAEWFVPPDRRRTRST